MFKAPKVQFVNVDDRVDASAKPKCKIVILAKSLATKAKRAIKRVRLAFTPRPTLVNGVPVEEYVRGLVQEGYFDLGYHESINSVVDDQPPAYHSLPPAYSFVSLPNAFGKFDDKKN